MAQDKHQGWVANLNNGETVFDIPVDAQVTGELAAWGKLLERCEEEGLWVTRIQLQIEGKTWLGISKADGYCFFRDAHISGVMGAGQARKNYAGIGSVMGDVVYCTVIDEHLQSEQETRPLARMRAHCSLKPAGEPEASFEEFKEANLRQEAERRREEAARRC